MKATDLMIGDWVLINNIPHKIQAIDSIDAEIQADDEIYYVDLAPCLYKDKIMQSNSDNLSQYRESYLNKNIKF